MDAQSRVKPPPHHLRACFAHVPCVPALMPTTHLERPVHVLHAVLLELDDAAPLVLHEQVVGVHDPRQRARGGHGAADEDVGRADVVQQQPPGPTLLLFGLGFGL